MRAATRGSGPDLSVAVDDVLERAELAKPDQRTRVELLRGVADLGPYAELPAVGEARRGVDVDARRIDAQRERARRGDALGDDRFRVPAPVHVDVLDRLLDRGHDLH